MMYNIYALKSLLRKTISQRLINLSFHLPKAVLAAFYYRFPARKLTCIGVTGTDGKTTTVNLIYHLLNEAGRKAAMVSTVSAKTGEEEIDTGFHVTAPDPWLLQKLLRKMVTKGIEDVVLEVTSHGLDQHRFWGINFQIGVLTNVTHEHLDYHKTYENYMATKAKLLESAKIAILNKDDESYNNLKFKISNLKLVTYGIDHEADYTPKKFNFKTLLPGKYNQYNCLAAIAAVSQLKVSEKVIQSAIASFKGVAGRMEEINLGQNFKVFVDFAHTPNALEQVLGMLRRQRMEGGGRKTENGRQSSRLIVVFGAAGLRDKEKRPMMGEIACRLADLIVLTAEDPRTEKVEDIIDQIADGVKKNGGVEKENYFRIPDRQEAINFAIQKLAKKGDIVVICGKGHEKSMCYGQIEYFWSDQEAVKKALLLPAPSGAGLQKGRL